MVGRERVFTSDGRTAYRCPWHTAAGQRCTLPEGDPQHHDPANPDAETHLMRPLRVPPRAYLTPNSHEILSSPQMYRPGAMYLTVDRNLRRLVGRDLGPSTPVDSEGVWEHWIQFLADRILTDRDATFVITGNPGEGKSTLGLVVLARLRAALHKEMRSVSKTIDLERDLVNRESVLIKRIDESSRDNPSLLLVDEAALSGLMAGSGLSAEGRLMDQCLQICRAKSAVLALCVPSIWALASFARSRRLALWLHCERRGFVTVLVPTDRLDFRPNSSLNFMKAKQPWTRLHFGPIDEDPIWKPYSDLKMARIKEALVDAEIQASQLEHRAGKRPAGAWQMDWVQGGSVRAGSGRKPGEGVLAYRHRHDRERKAAKRAAQREAGQTRTGNPGNADVPADE